MIVVRPSGAIMPAFLIIASLSLVFYLGVLVFLYRDGRKRRLSGDSVYKVQARSVAELGQLSGMIYAAPPSRRRNTATVLVRFAANSGGRKLKPQVVHGEAAATKVITLPTLVRDNDDAQCG
jgi:hypothetical protein